MQDEEIVALYWQREEQAIRETEQKYGRYLIKIARNVLLDAEDSRETVNDTYLKAWNSMPPHRPGILATYLGKITRQLSLLTDFAAATGRKGEPRNMLCPSVNWKTASVPEIPQNRTWICICWRRR